MKNLKLYWLILLLAIAPNLWAQIIDSAIVLNTLTGSLHGSLSAPKSSIPLRVVLLISGSGPTDRDGNNTAMKNNSLKLLSEWLYKQGVASVRYDKRGIAASKAAMTKEENLRFDTYVEDAVEWIRYLKTDKRFSIIIVAGHSEGSLVGMIASQREPVNGFVSLAGAGRPADVILKEQLDKKIANQVVLRMVNPIIDSLKAGHTVDNVDPMFNALFRRSVQPYLISWFAYNPAKEIAKLDIPILLMQGNNDLQVKGEDVKNLANGNPKAQLVYAESMNHVLKDVDAADIEANLASYSNPDLPLSSKMKWELIRFVRLTIR